MGAAQLHGGQLLVVLGVAGVVVTHQRAAEAGQNPEPVEGGVAAVVGRAEPDQLAGAGGVDVEQPIGVITSHASRGLVVMHHRRGAQPILQQGLEPDQPGGDPADQATSEAGRDRGVQQHTHQIRSPLDAHVPVAGQQRGRGPHVRSVAARPGHPGRRRGASHRPTAWARHRRQLVLGDLQFHRRGVKHLDPGAHPARHLLHRQTRRCPRRVRHPRTTRRQRNTGRGSPRSPSVKGNYLKASLSAPSVSLQAR
jgi:hypothetical protein